MSKKNVLNERRIIDALITRLDCSNGDAQGVYEAATMSRPELFSGLLTEAQVIDAICA